MRVAKGDFEVCGYPIHEGDMVAASSAISNRCVGAAFATVQIKAIFSVLLREFAFEIAQPSEGYRIEHSKMVVQLARPVPQALEVLSDDEGDRLLEAFGQLRPRPRADAQVQQCPRIRRQQRGRHAAGR